MSAFQCPDCSSSFQIMPKHAGRLVSCPNCKQSVLIPKSETKQNPAPAKTRPSAFKCPQCNNKFGITESMSNSKVACPHCNAHVQIGANKQTEPQTDLYAPGIPTNTKPGEPLAIRTEKKKARPKKEISLPNPHATATSTSQSATAKPPRSPKGKSLPAPAAPDRKSGPPKQPVFDEIDSGQSKSSSATSQSPPIDTAKASTKKDDASTTISVSQSTVPGPPSVKSGTDKLTCPIDCRLPPKFTAVDPDEKVQGNLRGENDHNVILPDGEGGFQRIDSRVVHVERDGKKVQLYSAPKEKKERKRFLQNILAIGIGIALLAIAFYLLLNW